MPPIRRRRRHRHRHKPTAPLLALATVTIAAAAAACWALALAPPPATDAARAAGAPLDPASRAESAIAGSYASADAAFDRRDIAGLFRSVSLDYRGIDADGRGYDAPTQREFLAGFTRHATDQGQRTTLTAFALAAGGRAAVARTSATVEITLARGAQSHQLVIRSVHRDAWTRAAGGAWQLRVAETRAVTVTADGQAQPAVTAIIRAAPIL